MAKIHLMGGDQHGHLNAVSFDTYVRLPVETVRERKGEEVPTEISFQPESGLDMRIPAEYIDVRSPMPVHTGEWSFEIDHKP